MNVCSIKFQGNPSSVGRAATDGQTGMTKLIGAFLYCANAPNKTKVVPYLSGSQWATKHIIFRYLLFLDGGPLMVTQWLRYCATNRKVAGSIPDGVTGFFH
jgi:hypothetical protein